MGIEIRNDRRDQILNDVNHKILKALEECGMMAETYASNELTSKLSASSSWYTRTGLLRNSIGHKVDASEKKMIIGAGADYAKYVEYGTGIYYSGGRKTSWVYYGADGQFHLTSGMKPKPFIKPAIADHYADYKQIFENNLK